MEQTRDVRAGGKEGGGCAEAPRPGRRPEPLGRPAGLSLALGIPCRDFSASSKIYLTSHAQNMSFLGLPGGARTRQPVSWGPEAANSILPSDSEAALPAPDLQAGVGSPGPRPRPRTPIWT